MSSLPLPLSVLCFLRVETAVGAGTDGRRKGGKSSPTVALRTKAARSLPPPTPDEGEETPRSKCHERRAARARRTRRHSSERVVRGEPCTPLPLLLIRDFKKFDNFTRNQTELPAQLRCVPVLGIFFSEEKAVANADPVRRGGSSALQGRAFYVRS